METTNVTGVLGASGAAALRAKLVRAHRDVSRRLITQLDQTILRRVPDLKLLGARGQP